MMPTGRRTPTCSRSSGAKCTEVPEMVGDRLAGNSGVLQGTPGPPGALEATFRHGPESLVSPADKV